MDLRARDLPLVNRRVRRAGPTRRAALGLVLAGASVRGAPGRRPIETVEMLYEDGRVYVPVRLGTLTPRWFILDTGLSSTVIDRDVALEAGLAPAGDEAVTGAGPGRSSMGRAPPQVLRVGDIPLTVAEPRVAALAGLLGPTSGRAPAGIVGSQLFREHVVAIDFQRRRLTLHEPAGWRYDGAGEAFGLSFTDDTPLASVSLALADGRTVAAQVLVDLGAKATLLLPEPFIAAAALRSGFPRLVSAPFGAGFGGDTRYAFGRARRLSLKGSARIGLDDPVVGLSVGGTLKSTWHQGLLGAEFLERFHVIFDYARSRLILEPTGLKAAAFDMSGLFLIAGGPSLAKVLVREILPDTPAAASGVASGDEVLSVDGAPTASLGLAGVRARLKAGPGRVVQLALARGETRRKVDLRLAQLI
jgi:hypothetical protein